MQISILITRGGGIPLWSSVMNYREQSETIEINQFLISKGVSIDKKNFHADSPREVIRRIGRGIDPGQNNQDWDLRNLLK